MKKREILAFQMTCETDVETSREVFEKNVVGPVNPVCNARAPVDPEPEEDHYHGQGDEEQQELGHNESCSLVPVALDLRPGKHCCSN